MVVMEDEVERMVIGADFFNVVNRAQRSYYTPIQSESWGSVRIGLNRPHRSTEMRLHC